MAARRLIFDAFAPPYNGASLGEITKATGKQIIDVFNGLGSGRFIINRHDTDMIPLVATDNLIKVRLTPGGSYVFAFFIEDSEDEMLNEGEQAEDTWERGGRGIMAYFGRAHWWKETFQAGYETQVGPRDDGNYWWYNDQYGDILRRMIVEDENRPIRTMPRLTYDFTANLDSFGVPWTDFDGSFSLPVGQNYLDSRQALIEQGLRMRMSPDFLLQASEDLTTDDTDVVFRGGWNIRESSTRTVHAPLRATRVLVRGLPWPDTGAESYVDVTDSQTAALEAGPGGRKEAFLDYGKTASITPLTRVGRKFLAEQRTQTDGPLTLGVTHGSGRSDGGTPAAADYEPYTDYIPGSKVLVDIDPDYDNVEKLITSITIVEKDSDPDAGDAEDGYDVNLEFDGEPFDGSSSAGGAGGDSGSGADSPGCKCPKPVDCQDRYSFAAAPALWYPNTSPTGENPGALFDDSDTSWGTEDYPSGLAIMQYEEAFVATSVYMRQRDGADTVGIGGFGKNSAEAWHIEAWPEALGIVPAPAADWLALGAVNIFSVTSYSQDYDLPIPPGAPLSKEYRIVMDDSAYTGGDARNAWMIYEFVLRASGETVAPDLPAECPIHNNNEFGMSPQVGDSLLYFRGDGTNGTPELGGVKTVPVDVAQPPVEGDILVVTDDTAGAEKGGWRSPAEIGLVTEDTVNDLIDDHEEAVDPHTQYMTESEVVALLETTGPASGHYEPLTNGDVDSPELIFAEGDVVMVWVPG